MEDYPNDNVSSREFQLRKEARKFFIPFLTLPSESKILIVEWGTSISDAAESEGHHVIRIGGGLSTEEQIGMINDAAPYDGVVVLPRFGRSQISISPPGGWNLRKSFAEDLLLSYAVEGLSEVGLLAALVSYGLLTGYTRRPVREGLIKSGLFAVASIPVDLLFEKYSDVSLGMILLNRHSTDLMRKINFVDLMNYAELPSTVIMKDLLDVSTAKKHLNLELVTIDIENLSEDLRLDPQYYAPTYLKIKAPDGYSDYALGEIADIRGGRGGYKRTERFDTDPGNGTPYCQVRHILINGEISDDALWLNKSRKSDDETGWAMPGDILVTNAGTIGKLAIVSPKFERGIFYDTSIRRIRVAPEYATPRQVFSFLRSEIGQLQFRRMTSGTVIPQITSPSLEAIRVFLPPPDEMSLESPISALDESTPQSRTIIADAIDDQVVQYLRITDDSDTGWQFHIRQTLQDFLENLLPKTLHEAVLSDYPAPLAIPYRRFMGSRFNNYERLVRLIALVESIIYFGFHVLLCDYVQNDWHSIIPLEGDAKAALRGDDSIDHRLKFIEKVFQGSKEKDLELFMPELISTSIVSTGHLIRRNVRNPTSHTAPGAEQKVKNLIEDHIHQVDNLLHELRFLSEYTLCRVRSHSMHLGRWSYRAEIYRGAEYDVNIQEVPLKEVASKSPQFIEAEREHLVLINSSNETLDMYPFYQIYFGDETGSEPHLCFYKRCAPSQSLLQGESVRSGVEVELEGFDRFMALTRGKDLG